MHTKFAHPFHGPGSAPGHYPMFDHDLDDLLSAYRASSDWLTLRDIERRIEQAVPGMTQSLFCASDDTQRRAARAVTIFREFADGDTGLRAELRWLLSIEQPELSLQPTHAA